LAKVKKWSIVKPQSDKLSNIIAVNLWEADISLWELNVYLIFISGMDANVRSVGK